MHVDWAVAMGIFAVFAGWSFIYYFGMFPGVADVSQSLDSVSEDILSYLETEEYRIPVSYDSSEAGHEVLFADIMIPSGMENVLGVLSGGSSLDCMFSGGRLYWEHNLVAGENLFEIVYSGIDTGGCQDALDTSEANQTYPLAAVKTMKLSQGGLSALGGMDYQDFREFLGLQNNIRLEWSGDIQGSYGPEPPGNRDVFVREISRLLIESGGNVNMRILLWE